MEKIHLKSAPELLCCDELLLDGKLNFYVKGQIVDFTHSFLSIPHGLMARIPGFHPGGPGSIPGVGEPFFVIFFFFFKLLNNNNKIFFEII